MGAPLGHDGVILSVLGVGEILQVQLSELPSHLRALEGPKHAPSSDSECAAHLSHSAAYQRDSQSQLRIVQDTQTMTAT